MGWDVDLVPVSVVIPAFNEARRLPGSLPVLEDMLRRYPGAELIVVDDGSTDGTARAANELLRGVPDSQVISLPRNYGKGAAIRVGVAAAAGEAIVFMDADLASDVADLPALLAALEDAEVAVGSRRVGGGADRTATRRLGSWAFNQLTRSLTALDLADTQCGFKAFRRTEAKILFSLSRAAGFGFDVEVLALARSLGYRIAEVPVRWTEAPNGTFSVVRHTPTMLADLVRARRHIYGGPRASSGSPGPVGPVGPVATQDGLSVYNPRRDASRDVPRARGDAGRPSQPHADGPVSARPYGSS